MKDYRMVIANPGINSSKEINISWHSDLNNKNTFLEYKVENECEWVKVYPKIKKEDCFNNIYSVDNERNDIYEEVVFLHCTVNLKKLKTDTNYVYRINGDSEIYKFKTAPKKDFSFIWISDFHAYNPAPKRLLNASNMINSIDEKHPNSDFVLCSGDSIAWGGSYSFWNEFYKIPSIKKFMWVNMLGNHDYMSRANLKNTSKYFKVVNNLPKNGFKGQKGICYYFKYANALFIVLHNEEFGVSEPFNEKVNKAISWVENVIKKNPSDYIFLCQHYQWINGVNGRDRAFGYERWKALCDKYHVDLAIAANDHTYMRTYPIYKDTIDEFGTVYMQCPSSDGERGVDIEEVMSCPNHKIAHRYATGLDTVGGIYVNVGKDGINTIFYDRDMNVVDECFIRQKNR